jgi:hypothetical protein
MSQTGTTEKRPVITTQGLLDAMADAMYQSGKPATHIDLTPQQYAELRDNPDILQYANHEGYLDSFAGVRINIVRPGEQI